MEIIRLLGFELSNQIKISPTAARGLIKLAMKDELGSFIEFSKVTFSDLKLVIDTSLKKRLIQFQILDINSLIEELTEILNKNQSLITMTNI